MFFVESLRYTVESCHLCSYDCAASEFMAVITLSLPIMFNFYVANDEGVADEVSVAVPGKLPHTLVLNGFPLLTRRFFSKLKSNSGACI